LKAVVQRVLSASVRIDSKEVSRINKGFLVFLGVKKGDEVRDAVYMARKIAGLRVFNDKEGKMNLCITDPGVQGEILAVSQFTLLGDLRKGRRPSFEKAEEPKRADQLFGQWVQALRDLSIPVKTGVFGAMMEVSLVNDGPVTLWLDSDWKPAK
jgi:D-tyrosyl-tRNA(Tyr) deacylase